MYNFPTLTNNHSVPFSVPYPSVAEQNKDDSIPTQLFQNCDFPLQLHPLPLPPLLLLPPLPPVEPMHSPVFPTFSPMHVFHPYHSSIFPGRISLTPSFLQRPIDQAAPVSYSGSNSNKDFEVVSLLNGKKIRVILVNQEQWIENTEKLTFIVRDTLDWKTFYGDPSKFNERMRYLPRVEFQLKEWMTSHPDLNPTEVEKKHLMEETGLDYRQVSNWLNNTRKRGFVLHNPNSISSYDKLIINGLEIVHIPSQKKISVNFFAPYKNSDNETVQFYTTIENWALFTTSIGVNYQFAEEVKKERFGTEKTQFLIDWYEAHESFPYPSNKEKAILKQQTGLSTLQINTWFVNMRCRTNRLKKAMKPGET